MQAIDPWKYWQPPPPGYSDLDVLRGRLRYVEMYQEAMTTDLLPPIERVAKIQLGAMLVEERRELHVAASRLLFRLN